jgi:putative acetyltransferase
VNIREERPDDQDRVREVHVRAFRDHGRLVADLVDALRGSLTPQDGLCLVAEHDGLVARHVMFTRPKAPRWRPTSCG